MVLGGTLCGIEEEAVAFYPILVPIFIAMGYDSIVCVGAIFLASSVGTAFSTINPFSAVIASNAAGIDFTQGIVWRIIGLVVAATFLIFYLYWYSKKVKNQPTFSYTYEDRESFNHMWSVASTNDQIKTGFSMRKKLILTLFVVTFPIMVWGVMSQGWWFPTMASSFLVFAIIIMFLTATGPNGLGEKGVVDAFVAGASSLVGVSLIIGLARGINLVMNEGLISDTILQYFSSLVAHVSGPIFILVLMFIFFILGFIVPSSSGLAVLAMPIFAPLADTVNIPRFAVVTAYQFGQYAMLFLAPTGLVMATLQMLDMKYSHWFRFVWPVVVFVLTFGGILLVLEVLISGV
ncbi:Arginine/ornithine antiporter ArcD [Levilactobacillus brevis]|nr:Arginine/ornithine antiporter ArcD [Levilactobacillus brevis]